MISADRELERMVERRARKGDMDPDDRDGLWKASVKAYNDKRRQRARLKWHLYHMRPSGQDKEE